MVNGLWIVALVLMGALWVDHMIRTAPQMPGAYSRLDNLDGLRETQDDERTRS